MRSAEPGISNARAEAVDDGIELTMRMGYGFRNTDDLVALVMLRCPSLSIAPPGRS